jgi:hypothetical protein
MSIPLSSRTKVGYGSDPTPQSVKDNVTKIEQAIVKEIGEFTPFANNKPDYKELLVAIQDDLRTVRPIIEYVYANGGKRAFKVSNLLDTFHRFEELKKIVEGESNDLDMPSMEGAPGVEGESAIQGLGEDSPEDPLAGASKDPLAAEPTEESDGEDAESLLKAFVNAIMLKHATELAVDEESGPTGLSDKIEQLYFLGRIDDLQAIKNKTERIIRIGELLATAINNEGRPTLAAIEELSNACKEAISDISVVESAVDALNHLPDRLESIVDLLKISLLERIQEIKGTE